MLDCQIQRGGRGSGPVVEEQTPLVIYDRDLPGEDWREAFAKLGSQSRPLRILLASRVVDDYLWEQVIHNHGFDVVAKPFQPERLRRVVTFAWSWREIAS